MTRNLKPGLDPALTSSTSPEVNEAPEACDSGRDSRGRFTAEAGGNATHGGYLWRNKEQLPAFAEHLRAEIDGLIESYVNDLGGETEITAGQSELLSMLRTEAGFRRLLELDLQARGLTTTRGRVRATAHLLQAVIDREERLIKRLGLTRKARPTRTLTDWIAEQDEREDDDVS